MSRFDFLEESESPGEIEVNLSAECSVCRSKNVRVFAREKEPNLFHVYCNECSGRYSFYFPISCYELSKDV